MYDSKEQSLMPSEFLQNDNTETALINFFHTLWLRKRLLISVTFSLSILAILIIYQLVPRYTATTQLLVGINAAKVVDIEQVLSGNLKGDTAVIGEMEVLKSRELAHKVIDTLHLDQYKEFNPKLRKPGFLAQFSLKNLLPESWQEAVGLVKIDSRTDEEKEEARLTGLTNAFLGKLKISQVKRSQVINVAFESEDPKLAAKIANEVADKYIVGQLQAKFDATKKATDWLNDQLGELKKKVETSERAVEQYRKTHELIEVKKEVGLSQQQMSEVNSQLIIARAQRAEAEAKYQQVEAIARSGRDTDSVAEVLNSSLISSLRQQESEVQRKYSEMLVEFGPRHPRMIQMQAELEDIQGKVRSEVKKIAAGLHNNMDVARAREGSLTASLRQMESKTTGNNQAEVELHALEREATANKALFETFLGRFKETASTQGIEQADARVISFAEIPLGASYPKKKLLLVSSIVGSLLVGVFLVFVLEMLNPGVRSPEQIQELFNMSTLGIVPKVMETNIVPHEYLLAKPQSALAEAVNTLRISLSLLNPDAEVKSLLVTSSVPGEGKSTLAVLIARHSACAGQRVVLIDTDLRRPTVGKMFKIKESTLGLTDLLMHHDLSINDVLVDDPDTGMKILTRGKSAFVNPVDLFASQRMKIIVEQLREQYDLVILDSAPIMAVPDTRILAGLVDKTIFVLNWDSTPKKVVHSALHLLNKDGHSNIAGIVLQKVNLQQYGRYGYGDSGYYYHYGRYNQYYSG
ncbi:GumC family protein [Candidatus Methylobacter oryzae]|uniref:non-specific protein-tyrosine kinase n=1 Tax=Candidatus Methylobacter oryzae TaxID=2497749 RepID=A0ABY3C852_9GAMM|nr:polysaccharide biosynthesis tyrosine autokinase [Candidatus Methylobacter oryzae]TRW91969.1 polysaccharide biosynthesis tyrosine autokinase [Candidatus Methylobacter oryzae]